MTNYMEEDLIQVDKIIKSASLMQSKYVVHVLEIHIE